MEKFSKASFAYAEQVGVKRQHSPTPQRQWSTWLENVINEGMKLRKNKNVLGYASR